MIIALFKLQRMILCYDRKQHCKMRQSRAFGIRIINIYNNMPLRIKYTV